MLSEFLMVEQAGFQLYTVVEARARDPELKERYREFGAETSRHREILVGLIEKLGGDPNYVSPTARVAQVKGNSLLETALKSAGLSAEELELSDLHCVVLAETTDQGNWAALEAIAARLEGAPDLAAPMMQALQEVGPQEEEHLGWARMKWQELCLRAVLERPAPPPERWMERITNPQTPVENYHPAPVTQGLLAPSKLPMWQNSLAMRSMQGPSRASGNGRSRRPKATPARRK
jgi:hypothetical protein